MAQADVIRSSSLTVVVGAELLDSSDAFIQDISDEFVGGVVSRDSTATIHGAATFELLTEIDWQNQRIKPYITLTDDLTGESYTYSLGVYLPETPKRLVGESPAVFQVEAYDKLIILDTPYGATYRVAAASSYITTVEGLLDGLSLSHNIDQTAVATTTPSDLVWELDEKNTYLHIINDLLTAIGYRELYVDRDGVFVSEPWTSPSVRTPIFTYDTGATDSVVLVGGLEEETDLFPIPNKWVFVLNNPDPALSLPTEGAGIYTVTNQSDGPTSIDARGRTKTKVVRLDAANHATLVAQGDRIVEEDKQPVTEVVLRSALNPLHWHDEVVTVTAPEVGLASVLFSELSWGMELPGGPMTHVLRKAS